MWSSLRQALTSNRGEALTNGQACNQDPDIMPTCSWGAYAASIPVQEA